MIISSGIQDQRDIYKLDSFRNRLVAAPPHPSMICTKGSFSAVICLVLDLLRTVDICQKNEGHVICVVDSLEAKSG